MLLKNLALYGMFMLFLLNEFELSNDVEVVTCVKMVKKRSLHRLSATCMINSWQVDVLGTSHCRYTVHVQQCLIR